MSNTDGEDTQRDIEWARLKYQVGQIMVAKFLEYNDGKFHTGLEFNPAVHVVTEFIDQELASLREQLAEEKDISKERLKGWINCGKELKQKEDENRELKRCIKDLIVVATEYEKGEKRINKSSLNIIIDDAKKAL